MSVGLIKYKKNLKEFGEKQQLHVGLIWYVLTLFMPIFILSAWSFNTDYDSETDDDNEELENSPPAKRQKLDVREESSGSSASPSSKNTNVKDERCLPFLLTRVRGIPSEFNARNLAIGIKGIHLLVIESTIKSFRFLSD